MFQNDNSERKQRENQLPNQFSSVKSAFKLLNMQGNKLYSKGENEFKDTDQINTKNQNQIMSLSLLKDSSLDAELWTKTEIQRLFKLYDYYGPQWKVMSQHMPTRSANNLKNRFYTVLRNLIKLLFRKKSNTCPKLSGQIPSKDLSRLYDGKQDYQQFVSLTRTILQQLDYNLESQNIDFIVSKYSEEIIRIYQVIYKDRLSNLQEEQRNKLRKSSQMSPNLATSNSSFNKGRQYEDDQKFNQEIKKQSNQIINGVTQQPKIFYIVFLNPSEYFGV